MAAETIGTLAAALAKAQAAIKGASKDTTNPHFKSKYADLASVWDACRKPLSDNGLSVVQFTQLYGEDRYPVLVTRLLHASGESVEGVTPLLMAKQDMQALGSALTYARRYGLAAIVGVAPEDDDGNAAVGNGRAATATTAPPERVKPEGYDDWRDVLDLAADTSTVALKETWTKAKAEYRAYLNATAPLALDTLKARAANVEQVPA